jgi:hypothetical protein
MARGRKPLPLSVKIARLEAQLAELRKQQETPKTE